MSRTSLRLLSVLFISALITGLATLLPRDNAVEGWFTDHITAARVSIFGEAPLDSPHVLVIGMDRRSLEHPLLSARPRILFSPVYTDMIDRALEHGAKGVVLDLILAYDPAGLPVGEAFPLKSYDTPFLRLLRREQKAGRVVLGRSATLLPSQKVARMAGSNGLGLVEVPIGAGNVVRSVAPSLPDQDGNLVPTLSGMGRALLAESGGEEVLLLPPAPLDTLPSASLIDVLTCADDASLTELFQNRVVLLGGMLADEDRLKFADRRMVASEAVAPGNACAFAPPFVRPHGDETLPGVYAHAAAIDGAVSGWAPMPAPEVVRLGVVALAAALAALAALWLTPALGGLVLAALAGTLPGGAILALHQGVFLPSAVPLLGAGVAFAALWGLRVGLLDRQANATRRAFGRYLSPVLVDRMIDTGEMPELGGEERDVTVVFADLSGFTATSEKMESADLTDILNRYLDRIDGVIRENGGYVDKFIGDAVMAIWNAPARIENHALSAVNAAHLIVRAVAEVSAEDQKHGLPGFTIKVGISSGTATVGNVGSHDRLNYTVIGDTVNQAARFESLPGLFKTPIVIGPETASRVVQEYELLPIVSIQVKGKTNGLRVFAPMAPKGTLHGDTMGRLSDYAIALQAFEEGSFETAAMLWDDLCLQAWPGAEMSGALADEARYLIEHPPIGDWTGVLEARGK